MEHSKHAIGTIAALWLYIIGHIVEINQGFQALAFFGAFLSSALTIRAQLKAAKKDK